jgi:hypothetical protein
VADKVTHYFPDAMVIFVKGFSATSPKDLNYIVASNLGEVKEISSINIDLTVKNSPGTFNLTIVDTANRFIFSDTPDTEIPILYNTSNGKISSNVYGKTTVSDILGKKTDLTNVLGTSTTDIGGGFSAAGNYYEFKTYDDWLDFEHGVLEEIDTKQRYPVYYVRNKAGVIFERFAFDQGGNIIKVVPKDDLEGETTYQNIESGDYAPFSILYVKGNEGLSTETYRVWKFKNSDFINRYRDIEEQGTSPTNFVRGRCKISPMDRVVIFMSERFGDGEYTDETTKRKLTRVFTGVVNVAQQGYSGNQNTITVSGEDVTKYMRLSVINVNPSLPTSTIRNVEQGPDDIISIWSDVFSGLDAPSVVKAMCLGGGPDNKSEFLRNKVRGIGIYRLGGASSDGNLKYDPVTDSFERSDLFKNQSKEDRYADFTDALGILFKHNTVHIINPFVKGSDLEGFRAYELALKDNWSFYQADFKTRREIAYQVAEETNFCFYANRFGEIWFHPPRFSNAHILGAKNPRLYIIDTESIISYGFVEDDSQIYTSAYISTTPAFGLEGTQQLGMYTASFRDDNSVLKYGQRIYPFSNPLINASSDKNSDKVAVTLQMFAKGLLQKLLAGKYQGQVTIVGRAELDPGYPVYIPIRNMVYYVESLSHSFTFGDQFTTTLNLSYGRKPWEFVPEVLTYSSNDETYQTDAHITTDFRTKAERDAETAKVAGDNAAKGQAQESHATHQSL